MEELPFVATETPLPTLAPTAEPIVTPTLEPYSVDGLRQFFDETAAGRLADRQDLVNRYVALMPPNPLADGRAAAIVYQGPGNQVEIIGDLNNWAEPTPLERLPDTDLWVLFLDLEPAARLDYLLRVDGRDQLDPRNPLTEVSQLGPRSKLVMPGYEAPIAAPPVETAGAVEQHILESTVLNQTRTLFIYTPTTPPPAGGYPLIVFLDGTDHLNLIQTPDQLDRLIAAEIIPPAAAVFVPPIDRLAEYGLNDDFVNFLVDEVVPFARRQTRAASDPEQTVIVGQGTAGATAVYTALTRPGQFGRVISQSGIFTQGDIVVLGQITPQEGVPIELYLTVGSYETAISGTDVVAANRQLHGVLLQKSVAVTLDQRPEGHSWGLWRERLGPALSVVLDLR